MYVLLLFLLYGIPIAVLISFIVSLIFYISTPKDNAPKRKQLKTLVIVLGSIVAVFVIAIVLLLILLALAIANM